MLARFIHWAINRKSDLASCFVLALLEAVGVFPKHPKRYAKTALEWLKRD